MASKVQIYTTRSCAYCVMAKRLFAQRGITYEELDCSTDQDKRMWLVSQTGRRTVPQIFIDDVPIGGFDDLSVLDRSGELAKIMAGETKPQRVD
jgi:glutaredoxin 3